MRSNFKGVRTFTSCIRYRYVFAVFALLCTGINIYFATVLNLDNCRQDVVLTDLQNVNKHCNCSTLRHWINRHVTTTFVSKYLHHSLLEHKFCIVVPFRDRFDELQGFVPHITAFLRNQSISGFQILVINQVDVLRFNRASLVNVGYYESELAGCDYFAMHDVDLWPRNPELNYNFPAKGPYHVAAPDYHPRYHYRTFIGGILLMTLQQYKLVNGMSNKYWGWGLEDDEFYLRLREARLQVVRPFGLNSTVNDTFYHEHDRQRRTRDMRRLYHQKQASRRRDRVTGLHDVRYEVLSRKRMTVDDAPFIVVNVLLLCDEAMTPWCVDPDRRL